MREIATVIKTEKNKAVIRVERSTACGECGKCMVGKKNLNIDATVDNILNAKVGDSVVAEMQLGGILSASWIMYAIPLLAFITGALLGYFVVADMIPMNKDLCGFALGMVLTSASYLLIRLADKKGAFGKKYSITMVDINNKTEE